jgi:glycosyltransferase involved in cell wall biosynthesis
LDLNYPDLYIALPAYNEEKVIRDVLEDLKNHGFPNIIIVNDGSSDLTSSIAQEHGAIVLSHMMNRGAGAASQTAITFAKRKGIKYLALMDADGQHHTEDLVHMFEALMEQNLDIVVGNRFDTKVNEIPRSRIFFNSIANKLTNLFCKKSYSDTQSGFRLLNRKAIEKFDLKVDGYGFCSEMIIVGEHFGLRIGEIPIKVSYTEYSMGKGQSLVNGIYTAFNFMWRIIFN